MGSQAGDAWPPQHRHTATSAQAHCPLALLLGNQHLREELFQPTSPRPVCTRPAPGPPVHPKLPGGNKPGPAGGRPQRKGPAPGVSVLSAARQGLGSPGLLSAAAQPRGNISSLGSLWRVLTSKAGHRRKQQEAEAGAAECDSLDEAWPQQIRNSPSGGAQPLKEQP